VLAGALAPLSSSGLAASVAVGPHKVHGTLATVTLSGEAPDREAAEAEVHRLLDPFAIRHAIDWRG
jgi:hypothetical protein